MYYNNVLSYNTFRTFIDGGRRKRNRQGTSKRPEKTIITMIRRMRQATTRLGETSAF